MIRKVGRTTGHTAGTVTNPCTTINLSGSDVTFLCQTQAYMRVDHGDSGAAGFTITNSPNTNDVTLRGILSTTSNPGQNGYVSFTRIGYIQDRMGFMQSCALSFSC